jgi:outer membrane protein assembly factor BamA
MINAEGGVSVGGTLSTANAEGALVRGRVGVLFGGLQQTHIEVNAPRVRGYYGRHHLIYFNRQRENTVLDFFEVANEVFAAFAPRLGEHTRAGLRAGYQRMRADEDGRTLSGDNVDDVNTLGLLFGLDTAGPPVLGRRGWWIELQVDRTGLLGGQAEFWRGELDLRRYQAVARRHVLALTSLVTVTSGEVGEEIAPWQTYHLGGTNTVRGWEVGSRSGKNQALGTAEWRWTVRDPDPLSLPFGLMVDLGVQIAAFGDAGLAWSGEADARFDRFIGGYGVGLRLVGPGIGRLRFDLAHGESGPTLRFYVGSGSKADAQRRRVR